MPYVVAVFTRPDIKQNKFVSQLLMFKNRLLDPSSKVKQPKESWTP